MKQPNLIEIRPSLHISHVWTPVKCLNSQWRSALPLLLANSYMSQKRDIRRRQARWATRIAAIVLLVLAGSCSDRPDSSQSRGAAEAARRSTQRGMSVADVVELAAAQDTQFSVMGVCAAKGALNVNGAGGDRGLVVWRGSPSGDGASPVEHFRSRSDIGAALRDRLLGDGPCSRLFVGFPGSPGWRFQVVLGADGLVADVKPTELWQ
jgi:hypothetical protein